MKVSTKALSTFAASNGCLLVEGTGVGRHGFGGGFMMRRGASQQRIRCCQGFSQGHGQSQMLGDQARGVGRGCMMRDEGDGEGTGSGGGWSRKRGMRGQGRRQRCCQGQMMLGGSKARGGDHGYMARGEGIGRGGIRGSDTEGRPRELIQRLLDNHDKFERQVELVKDGVHAETWVKDSDSIDEEERAKLAEWLQRHVAQMALQQYPVRSWDPLFAAIHNHGEDITLDWDPTEYGVSVTHSGATPCAAALAVEHSAVVSGFVDRGREEASQRHSVPLPCPVDHEDDRNLTDGCPRGSKKKRRVSER